MNMVSYPNSGLDLPEELILEIATYLIHRSRSCSASDDRAILCVSSLAAFSSASRRIRRVLLPLLFRYLPVRHEYQLLALAELAPELLHHCREFNIMMDESFLTTLQAQLGLPRFASPLSAHHLLPPSPPSSSSPQLFDCIVKILSRTPLISSLRFSIASPSAWHVLPLTHARGIHIASALRSSLSKFCLTSLPRLESLHVEALEGLSPLLALTPNLRSLALIMSAGFARAVNEELVSDVLGRGLVPNLRKLVYTPDTLRVRRAVLGRGPIPSGSAELLVAIGRAVPELEELDLQTRWFGGEDKTFFCSSSEPLCPNELTAALPSLPSLRSLRLPSSLASAPDYTLVRAPVLFSHPTSSALPSPTSLSMFVDTKHHSAAVPAELLASRRVALARDSRMERELFSQTSEGCALNELSLVRQVHESDRCEYAVSYSTSASGDGEVAVRVMKASGQEVEVEHAMDLESLTLDATEAEATQIAEAELKASPNAMSVDFDYDDDEEEYLYSDEDEYYTSEHPQAEETTSLWSPLTTSTIPWSFEPLGDAEAQLKRAQASSPFLPLATSSSSSSLSSGATAVEEQSALGLYPVA